MTEATKDWVGQVSIPIRSEIDGPVIGHVVELYPDGIGKCVMLDGTVDTLKLFHGMASINKALEYRLLVEDDTTVTGIPYSEGPPLPYIHGEIERIPHPPKE